MLNRQLFSAGRAALTHLVRAALDAAGRFLVLRRHAACPPAPPRPQPTKPTRLLSAPAAAAPHQPLGRPAPDLRAATPRPSPGNGAHALRGEFKIIPLSAIESAATPSRLIYEGVERLAASIAGGNGREALGLMAPSWCAVSTMTDTSWSTVIAESLLVRCSRRGQAIRIAWCPRWYSTSACASDS